MSVVVVGGWRKEWDTEDEEESLPSLYTLHVAFASDVCTSALRGLLPPPCQIRFAGSLAWGS